MEDFAVRLAAKHLTLILAPVGERVSAYSDLLGIRRERKENNEGCQSTTQKEAV